MTVWTDLAWDYYRLRELTEMLKNGQWLPEYVNTAAVVTEIKRLEVEIAQLEAEGALLNQEAEN